MTSKIPLLSKLPDFKGGGERVSVIAVEFKVTY